MSNITLPNLSIIRELGEGTFGKVYQASRNDDATTVAVKVLKDDSAQALDRFRREVRIMWENIHNPNVVNVLSWDLNHVPPYFVMEYCDGGNLRGWASSPRAWTVVASALLNVLHGLRAIHKAGGFHRDIKPENLLMSHVPSAEGKVFPLVKLADFGLARVPGPETAMTQHAFGTPIYMAPELIYGGEASTASDIFSFGITAVELFTGSRKPKSIDQAPIPDSLKATIRRTLAHAPHERPSCDEIIETLSLSLRTAELLEKLDKAKRDVKAVPAKRPPELPWLVRQQPPKRAGGDGLAALLLGGVAIAGLFALAAGAAGSDNDDLLDEDDE